MPKWALLKNQVKWWLVIYVGHQSRIKASTEIQEEVGASGSLCPQGTPRITAFSRGLKNFPSPPPSFNNFKHLLEKCKFFMASCSCAFTTYFNIFGAFFSPQLWESCDCTRISASMRRKSTFLMFMWVAQRSLEVWPAFTLTAQPPEDKLKKKVILPFKISHDF